MGQGGALVTHPGDDEGKQRPELPRFYLGPAARGGGPGPKRLVRVPGDRAGREPDLPGHSPSAASPDPVPSS